MEFLGGNLFLICGAGCLLAIVVFVILPFFIDIIGAVFDIFGSVLNLVQIGPLPGCGCFGLVALCGIMAALGYVLLGALSTCGTDEAVNFCRMLP